MPDVAVVEAGLRQMEAELDAARVAGDVAAFERVLAAEFRTVNPFGEASFREQTIADTASRTFAVRSSRSGDLVIRSYDDTATVSGRCRIEATYAGRNISGTYAYTHVYVLRDGRWQVVAAHLSRVLPNWLYFVMATFGRLLGDA